MYLKSKKNLVFEKQAESLNIFDYAEISNFEFLVNF